MGETGPIMGLRLLKTLRKSSQKAGVVVLLRLPFIAL